MSREFFDILSGLEDIAPLVPEASAEVASPVNAEGLLEAPPTVVVDAFEAAPAPAIAQAPQDQREAAPVGGAQGEPPVMVPFDDEGGSGAQYIEHCVPSEQNPLEGQQVPSLQ